MRIYRIVRHIDGTWCVPSSDNSRPLIIDDDKTALLQSACALARKCYGEVHVIDERGNLAEVYRPGDGSSGELDVTQLDVKRLLSSA